MKESIILKNNSDTLYLLIHGYTGSPLDFNGFPEYLYEEKGVDVYVPLLLGHGSKIEDLDDITFDDFVDQISEIIERKRGEYNKIIIGGLSWGAILSLYLASKYQLDGILNVNLPTKLRFPLNLPGLLSLFSFKKYWPKILVSYNDKMIEDGLAYKKMHINGLRLIREGKKRLKESLGKIKVPVYSLHSLHDRVGSYKSLDLLEKKLKTRHNVVLFAEEHHNVFYINDSEELYSSMVRFFENPVKNQQKVSAVVPAYNEEKHIDKVLSVLVNTETIDEVIVIDDNSQDRTGEIAKSFSQVRYFKNSVNGGKAISMQRGVELTDADIIFFCDADLKKLTPEIVYSIINPVLNKEYDMYIGLRNNIFQKMFKIFALNSGERAIRREIWEMIPPALKHRFRIEVAMNHFTAKYGKGFGSRRFDYYQTLKERKYGFLKGEILRWWMYYDVLVAYILVTYDDLKAYFSFHCNKKIWRQKY